MHVPPPVVALQFMLQSARSSQLSRQFAVGVHVIVHLLLFVHVSVHGGFAQVNVQFWLSLQVQFEPHSPLVAAPVSGVPASGRGPGDDVPVPLGIGDDAASPSYVGSPGSPAPISQSYEQPTITAAKSPTATTTGWRIRARITPEA
jgi:hypothetical protein